MLSYLPKLLIFIYLFTVLSLYVGSDYNELAIVSNSWYPQQETEAAFGERLLRHPVYIFTTFHVSHWWQQNWSITTSVRDRSSSSEASHWNRLFLYH